MAITDLANQPQQFVVGGKTYTVERLSVAKIFGIAEKTALENWRAEIANAAALLTGPDKISFLRSMIGQEPKGQALLDLADAWITSHSGQVEILLDALNKHQIVTKDEIYDMLLGNREEIDALVTFLIGAISHEKKA